MELSENKKTPVIQPRILLRPDKNKRFYQVDLSSVFFQLKTTNIQHNAK